MTPKRTHSPSLTSNTPAKRQKKHHPTDTTNRPGEDILPSQSDSEPEDALPRTTSHPSSLPRPVISSPSNDDEANGTDKRPYHAISMTAIQAQASYGSFIQSPAGSRPTTPSQRVATAADYLERASGTGQRRQPGQPPASADDSQIHYSPSVSLSQPDNIVAPEKSHAVQRGNATARSVPPNQQRQRGPFVARRDVTRASEHIMVSEVSPSLLQRHSSPEQQWPGYEFGGYAGYCSAGRPEPYRTLNWINTQSRDGSVDEYNFEASLFGSPSSANFLPAQRRATLDLLVGDPYEPPSWTSSRSSDRGIDGYRGQTTLPESPSLAPWGVPWPWDPQPIVASAISPLLPQQRGPSPQSHFVNDAGRFPVLPGRNSQGNSDIPEAPIRPSIQASSLPEGVAPPETYHRPLAGGRPDTSSSDGSANQYNRRVTRGSLAPSGVLASRKRDVTSLESPSLHQEPTHVHSLFSPFLDPLPGAMTSPRQKTRRPIPLARVTDSDTTNRPLAGQDISLSLSEPEDVFPRTTSHPSSTPRPVFTSPSNDDEANESDPGAGPYCAINMTAIRAQSSYGSFIQRPASERPCPEGGRPTTHRVATAADDLERGTGQPPASADDSQIHSSLSVSLSGLDNIVAPEKSRAVQHGGVTALPDQQRHTRPFAARSWNVTGSSEVSPSLGQPKLHSIPNPWDERYESAMFPEPYRQFSQVDSQSSLSDGSMDEYIYETNRFELPDSANFLPAQRRVTGMYLGVLGDSHEQPSSTNSRSSDRSVDRYRGQTTLPESPSRSLAPRGVHRGPRPIVASAASPLSPQQRRPSPRSPSRFVNDTGRFLVLPGRNSQGNSDVPGAPILPSSQARSLPEGVGPPETHSTTNHHWPLAGRRPNASSSGGGSANQHNRRVTAGLLPSLAPSGVLESQKYDVTSLESPSLHQEPTDVHSLFSPPLDPLPGATTSSRSPARPASIHTTRVTLPNQPQELPGRVDPEYSGDGSRRIAPPDERHDPGPVAAPCSLPESPNQLVTFAYKKPSRRSLSL